MLKISMFVVNSQVSRLIHSFPGKYPPVNEHDDNDDPGSHRGCFRLVSTV
jgi:hypothetical protein